MRDDRPIELARNPSWRKRLADVRRAKSLIQAAERRRKARLVERLAFVALAVCSAAITLAWVQC